MSNQMRVYNYPALRDYKFTHGWFSIDGSDCFLVWTHGGDKYAVGKHTPRGYKSAQEYKCESLFLT